MLIVIDYDLTYTQDPQLWDEFIDMALLRNHNIICVTMRYPEEGSDVINTVGKKCKVIFTGRKAKMNFLHELNIKPDIWIDDNPIWIYTDSG
jgi:hypothetical protein